LIFRSFCHGVLGERNHFFSFDALCRQAGTGSRKKFRKYLNPESLCISSGLAGPMPQGNLSAAIRMGFAGCLLTSRPSFGKRDNNASADF
jgi:hypothetical protein